VNPAIYSTGKHSSGAIYQVILLKSLCEVHKIGYPGNLHITKLEVSEFCPCVIWERYNTFKAQAEK
jgi:hypothetical protein